MKIGIVGAGDVGGSLGRALLKAGHEVMFSSRDPQSSHAQSLRAETGAAVGSVAETLAYSPVIVIALSPRAIDDLVRDHAGAWSNKIIIDLNNQMGPSPADKFGSFALYLASITHGRVVKAFNTIGAEHYQNPFFDGQRASMFIAGDDAEAKQITSQLASDIGFDVVDVGGLDASKLLEQLAALWVHLAYSGGYGRNIAFKLLQK